MSSPFEIRRARASDAPALHELSLAVTRDGRGVVFTVAELYTRQDNDRARALYESEGFVIESTRARFIRLPDGRYVDDLVYVRFF
jgi:ribosomal protein S18 acetylase RimI-like enzyme